MRNGIFPAISVNRGCHSHQQLQPSAMVSWWALRELRKERIPAILLLFSHSVMSDSLLPHGLQHISLSCPSPSPRACSNSCPLSRWCHPTISSSVIPFSSCLQSFPASGSFLITRQIFENNWRRRTAGDLKLTSMENRAEWGSQQLLWCWPKARGEGHKERGTKMNTFQFSYDCIIDCGTTVKNLVCPSIEN